MAAVELSPRQLDVLRLTALGHRVKCIAPMLGISEKSVSTMRLRIFKRIGARNMVHATRWAIAHGVVPVPTPEEWR